MKREEVRWKVRIDSCSIEGIVVGRTIRNSCRKNYFYLEPNICLGCLVGLGRTPSSLVGLGRSSSSQLGLGRTSSRLNPITDSRIHIFIKQWYW